MKKQANFNPHREKEGFVPYMDVKIDFEKAEKQRRNFSNPRKIPKPLRGQTELLEVFRFFRKRGLFWIKRKETNTL